MGVSAVKMLSGVTVGVASEEEGEREEDGDESRAGAARLPEAGIIMIGNDC